MVGSSEMNVDLSPIWKAVEPLWRILRQLFDEHHFLTIVCGFFVLMMIISFYRFLRSISPALVAMIGLLVIGILVMHWTATRTEPPFLTSFIDWVAPFFPAAPTPRAY
jgi:hypothetical protein